jgi:hypothetical protein
MGRLTDEEVWAWLVGSCVRQGIEPHVCDRGTVSRIAVLILGRPGGVCSDSPDWPDSAGVEAVDAAAAGSDDGVVQDGLHDGALPGEWEDRPLTA